LLNYFKENPEELTKEELKIHIHVAIWNFFNDGNNCSDYIEVFDDRLEVSCQDWYDDELRDEFHENIKQLLMDDFSVTVNNSLTSLHINVTEKCPAGCKTCYINKGLQRELRKEDWTKLPEAEQYAIGGGEPAEYPHIPDLVEYLKKEREGYVAITTNGQKIIEFKTFPDKIAVSIDGLTQDEHSITHNTDLKKAEDTAIYYRNIKGNKGKGIKVCINHIIHKENIDDAEDFANKWLSKGYEVNLILFTGDDILKPTFDQLKKFGNFFCINKDKRIVIDSCMGGILNISSVLDIPCSQGLFSKYYSFCVTMPCSHSAKTYPNCTVFEEYMTYFFKNLRPLVFIYDKSGTSGAHEWAFRAGLKGKIRHNMEFGEQLKRDTIYILTDEEVRTIKEPHYYTYFEHKMPIGIYRNYC
jgi:organic radical activating enzyme